MTKRRLVAAAALAALALPAVPADATTYPRTCGTTKVKGKKYVIRTHLLTCTKGKPYAIEYLKRKRAPKGWRCTNYDRSQTSVVFTCRRRNRDFLAIRK